MTCVFTFTHYNVVTEVQLDETTRTVWRQLFLPQKCQKHYEDSKTLPTLPSAQCNTIHFYFWVYCPFNSLSEQQTICPPPISMINNIPIVNRYLKWMSIKSRKQCLSWDTCQMWDPHISSPLHPCQTERDSYTSFIEGLLEALWLPLLPPKPLGVWVCERRSHTGNHAPVRRWTSHIPHMQTHAHICASLSNMYTPRLVKWLCQEDTWQRHVI